MVDPADAGASGAPEANPLGLSLGFIEGMALVSLRDKTLTEGLVVRALDLELAEVSFPLDLEGGAESFQRRSTRLRTLVLELHTELLAQRLQAGLARAQSPVSRLTLRPDSGELALEAELALQDRRALIAGRLALVPSAPRLVRLILHDVLELGYFPISSLALPGLLESAARQALAPFGERVKESLVRPGPTSLALDVVDALLWAIMPQSGWKMPQHQEAELHRVDVLPDGWIRVEVGDLSALAHRPASSGGAAGLMALAKDDAAGLVPEAERRLEAGDAAGAFRALADHLDSAAGPEVLLLRLLSLGSSDPRLFGEALDLLERLEARAEPPSPRAALALALARARIAVFEGRGAEAAQLFERAARALKELGRRRPAGLAYLAASRYAAPRSAERVRVLEEAIALLPDDQEALLGLVEELPAANRATAAVRAARRLAHVGARLEDRVRAHVVAGDLLRGPLEDPAQARREYERALKLAPEDELALEGLARAAMDQGEARRAATIFERLIERAEGARDSARAGKLSLVLGDLWRELDPDLALLRYRRAHELLPQSVAALTRILGAAVDAGKREVALEVVEQAQGALAALQPAEAAGGARAPEEAGELLRFRLRAGALLEREPGRQEEAVAHFEAALALDAASSDALMALADLYERTGQGEARARVLARHAEVLAQGGMLDAAARLWVQRARLVAEWPAGPARQESLSQVQAAMLAAWAHDRRHRGLLDGLLVVAELLEQPAALIEALDRRLLVDEPPKKKAELLERLGGAFTRAGAPGEAARAFEEAVGLDPERAGAIRELLRLYRARQDTERLAQILDRAAAAEADPAVRADHLAERAALLAAAGRDADAYAAVGRALEAAPARVALLPLATQLALRVGRAAEARALADRRAQLLREGQPVPEDSVLVVQQDRARAAEAMGDQPGLVEALRAAYAASAPASEVGRQLAARLSRELVGAQRLPELAELTEHRAEHGGGTEVERAERWVEAARLRLRLAEGERAKRDAERALHLADGAGLQRELVEASVDVLENLARAERDARALGGLLGRRARAARQPRERQRLRLEQAQVLLEGDLPHDAMRALEEASDELPTSVEVARALGRAAERADDMAVAASAFGRAARLAETSGEPEAAVELHGRAAAACERLGQLGYALAHDRALLALCPPGSASAWAQKAIERLEQSARAEQDHVLLVEVLSRRAAIAPPSVAARLLLEKARVESEALGSDRAALDSLRRARALAPEGAEITEQVDDTLDAALARMGLAAERAELLVERAERARSPVRAAVLQVAAAQVHLVSLHDRAAALSRAQAAVRADPQNLEARQLRLRLLREVGRKEPLVEALAEEAERSADAQAAARLWVEAAELLAPPSRAAEAGAERAPRAELERALELVRRAATAAPRSPEPLRVAAAYVRALGRWDEEFVCLGQLAERDLSPVERAALSLRRVELLSAPLGDKLAAQAELSLALGLVERLDPDERDQVQHYLPHRTGQLFELALRPLEEGLLRVGVHLAEQNADWSTHVRYQLRLAELAEDPEHRAELRTRAGEVLEWKLGDGAGAEREYRSALALQPAHARSRQALESFYLAVDRFGDLAENLGVETLRRVYRSLVAERAPNARLVAAGQALWPQLQAGSPERAELQLELADRYSGERADPPEAVHLLEQVVREGPLEAQRRALERLAVLFREQERFDLYADVLRRQAERIEQDAARAQALAELGEVLEWKLGDGSAAEREYRAALAIDPQSPLARRSLVLLLSSQDRFEELGGDLGAQALAEEMDQLLSRGPRERERAWRAAEALGRQLEPDRRSTMWLRLSERMRGEAGERVALERASAEAGPDGVVALDALIALFERHRDREALAGALRRKIEREGSAGERALLHYRLGVLLDSMAPEADGLARGMLEEEAERQLQQALAIDPAHGGARAALAEIYLRQGRLLTLGRNLGPELLREIKAKAEVAQDTLRLAPSIHALAELSSGEERAGLLVQLVEHVPEARSFEGKSWTPELLYRAALEADPAHQPAQEGLRALYEAEGRYQDIGRRLGSAALRESLRQLERMADRGAELPAALALAQALELEQGPAAERAELYERIAALQLAEGDTEAGELALRAALGLEPGRARAREDLRLLLVGQGRLQDLGDYDVALLAETGAWAAARGDRALGARVLGELATRRQGEERADTLVLLATLELERGADEAAERALLEALAAAPRQALARAELEKLWWARQRYADQVRVLGAESLFSCVERTAPQAPLRALRALADVLEALPERERARALELAAQIPGGPAGEEEHARRLSALSRARDLWDGLEDREGQERVRLSIAGLEREAGDAEALLQALADAAPFARSEESRALIALERATLLALSERGGEARALVEPLIREPGAPEELRARAARLRLEELAPSSAEAEEDRALATAALVLLTGGEGRRLFPERQAAWLTALAAARELEGQEAEALQALEAALQALPAGEGEARLALRRRLKEQYEQLGDWRAALVHAAELARVEGHPDLWVSVAELKVWLDDRRGAEQALEAALALEPGHRAAHASLVRLAEQEGEARTVIARLAAWAEHDQDGTRLERAERLLSAARLAAEYGDRERAADLAERAVRLAPGADLETERLAEEACALLEPLGAKDAMVQVLSRLLALEPTPRASLHRLRLADLLLQLSRADEARAVVEQGVSRQTPAEDPLFARLLGDLSTLPDDAGARRLLAVADRLGGGPSARRLRVLGAERAERAGLFELARGAWTQVAHEVGVGEDGARARAALLALARRTEDKGSLITALVDAADDVDAAGARASMLGEAARTALALDDAERAEALLRRAIAADPAQRELKEQLLTLLSRQRRWAALDEELAQRALAESGAARAGWLLRQAQNAREELKDVGRAAALYLAAYELAPGLEAGRALVECALAAESFSEAAVLAQRVLDELRPSGPPLYALVLLRAEALEREGAVERAAQALAAASDNTPGAQILEVRLLDLLARAERWRELASVLDAMAERGEVSEGLAYRIAAARILATRAGEREQAVSMLRRAQAQATDWLSNADSTLSDPALRGHWDLGEGAPVISPLLDLAGLARELKDPALVVDALRLHAQSLPVGPAQWRALVALASAERQSGELDAAEFTLQGVVDAVRGSSEVLPADRAEAERALGELLLARNSPEEAVEALERALALVRGAHGSKDSREAAILTLMARAQRARGRAELTLEALTEAHALDPRAVPEVELEAAVEAAGPSPRLARLVERRAEKLASREQRARALREAAALWSSLGQRREALSLWLRAERDDPSGGEHAAELERALAEDERWADLDLLLAARASAAALTDAERADLLLARARLALEPLAEPRRALELAGEARELAPESGPVLRTVALAAARSGEDEIQLEALARLAVVTADPTQRVATLARRALLLERGGELAGAAQALEEAVEISLPLARGSGEQGPAQEPGSRTTGTPRGLIERLVRLYARRGHWASEARLWVRVAEGARGPEAAAALSRAGHVRLEHLGDRRGAMAALEAAARAAPTDLGLRRSLIQLAHALGDSAKARAHAQAAAEAAEAAGEREAAEVFRAEEAPRRPAEAGGEAEEGYKSQRSKLDRSGRWAELAQLEEAHARTLLDPQERAAGYVAAGRLYAEHRARVEGGPEGALAAARRCFLSALERAPRAVEALSHLARLEVEAAAWEHAAAVFTRLELLGGPAWPVPSFELAGAEVARQVGDEDREVARLLSALDRDPASLEAASRLVDVAERRVRSRALTPAEVEAARGWLEGYARALDPTVDGAELARVALIHAELALQVGGHSAAWSWAERAVELDRSAEARAFALLRRTSTTGEGAPSHRRLAALLAEARASGAAVRWLEALDLALELEDRSAAVHAASSLESLAAPPEAGVAPRLLEYFARQRDGAALLRVADRGAGVRVLLELPVAARVAAVRACLSSGRGRDACALLVSLLPPATDQDAFARALVGALHPLGEEAPTSVRLDSPSSIEALRAFVLQLGAGEERTQQLLEGLHRLLPRELAIARALAACYLERDQRPAEAAAIYRALLAEDPLDAPALSALYTTLVRQKAAVAAEGPAAVLGLLFDTGARERSPMQASHRLSREVEGHVFAPEVTAPLGRFLRRMAHPLAQVLPPAPAAFEERTPAEEDPRLRDLIEPLVMLTGAPVQIWVDKDAGFRVHLEPGDPPSIVLGEALVDDAPSAELRFHLARAAMLIELGYLYAARVGADERRELFAALLDAADPEVSAPASEERRAVVELVRGHLTPSGLADVEPYVEPLRRGDPDFPSWMYGAVATADRVALLFAGELDAAVGALRRLDPRFLGDDFSTRVGRVPALRRSAASMALLRFVLSEGYAPAAVAARVDEEPGRF